MRRRPREMKESILDVLLYLFEHYFTDEMLDVSLVTYLKPGAAA